jgi:two-component system, OmpR family, sensor histidine kinase BaeS
VIPGDPATAPASAAPVPGAPAPAAPAAPLAPPAPLASPAIPARRRPTLAWRLGLILSAIVLGILLLAGIVVNRVVSGGFETVIADTQQQRIDDAAVALADRLDRPARIVATVRRLATNLGGVVRVVAPDGTVLAAFGKTPDGTVVTYSSPIEVDNVVMATLEADLPSGVGGRGFLPLFNLTLLIGGALSVLGIALASVYAANRLTRPLRDVADAARRLGAGETTARATGGDDRESAELADAFNAMADRLERSEMLRRRAASDIAHDLATPATVLVSQLQAMVDGVVPADRDGLEAARSAASALGSVVGQMNDLLSAEAAPVRAQPAVVEVRPAVREVEAALDGLRRERGVRIVVTVPADLAVLADPGQLARVLRNVVGNAITHSPTGGTVAVDARLSPAASGSVAAVRVSDQGAGIAAADVPHVFERFYRGDPARAVDPVTGRPGGTGIGLTIARELLVANGGRIDVERTGPDGTTFLIELPAAVRA